MKVLKKPFSALRASVSSNNKRGGGGGWAGPPGASLDPPLIFPHVRESKEFHAVDSGFKVLDSGPFVRETWIPDSRIPGFLELYSGFQSPYMGRGRSPSWERSKKCSLLIFKVKK